MMRHIKNNKKLTTSMLLYYSVAASVYGYREEAGMLRCMSRLQEDVSHLLF